MVQLDQLIGFCLGLLVISGKRADQGIQLLNFAVAISPMRINLGR
ncbi:hypothetical protein [Roseateles toxinivorans]|nr:hypothetical protein [Roseateles toxinivorans]